MTVFDKLTHAAEGFVGTALGDLFWYVLFAAGVWLFFDVVFRARFRHRRVFRRERMPRQLQRELLYSLRSIAVFALMGAGVVYAAYSGWTRIYIRVDAYGWTWFALSIAAMIVLHDAYFYWSHRLMHHPRLYRTFHHAHHLSLSPTPWAAYAFSPWEAFVQGGIGPLIVFTLPVHPAAIGLFMIWQIAFNVFGHCGYEIFPQWFIRSPAGWFLNSITHHTLHHEKFRANYGLYFNVWDRLMRTNCDDYAERFEQVTQPRPNRAPPMGVPASVGVASLADHTV
jgi:sterol desaturase/sphingolipid hydroxylase (fatty acid hydroxylase superfamily)